MTPPDVKITFYENSIPSFVETELERLYANVYSTLHHLNADDGSAECTSTYVAEQHGTPIAVLLVRIENGKASVLNEQINLEIEEVDRFTRHILARYPQVGIVSFNAICTSHSRCAYPAQRHYCTEDIVLELPASADDYHARLGKSTRKTINYRMNRLKRCFPSLHWEVRASDQIDETQIREIIALNRARMASKNKVSSLDFRETERIIRLARWRGLVIAVSINGRTCAGAICCRVGDNYFAHVLAHDPLYDSYRLGTLCAYLTICECIRRGGKEFHFLWGRYDYKYLLLGVDRALYRMTIYRSYLHLLLNGGTACRIAIAGRLQRLRSKLLENASRAGDGGVPARLSLALVKTLRACRQLGSRSLMQRD